jgi:hypothetical protein
LNSGAGSSFTRVPLTLTSAQDLALNTGHTRTTDRAGKDSRDAVNMPEFVRLADGRIVKNGPGIVCDENCVEAVPLARAKVSRNWYILPPLLAAGILCAVLCRGGADAPAAAPQTVVIQASPSPTLAPGTSQPNQVPEPGTLVLLGLGLSTMVARRKLANKQAADKQTYDHDQA